MRLILVSLLIVVGLFLGCSSSPTEPPVPEPSIKDVVVTFSNLIENHFTHVSIHFIIQNGDLDTNHSQWLYDNGYYSENITSTNGEYDYTNGLYIGKNFRVIIEPIPTAHHWFDETHTIRDNGDGTGSWE